VLVTILLCAVVVLECAMCGRWVCTACTTVHNKYPGFTLFIGGSRVKYWGTGS